MITSRWDESIFCSLSSVSYIYILVSAFSFVFFCVKYSLEWFYGLSMYGAWFFCFSKRDGERDDNMVPGDI